MNKSNTANLLILRKAAQNAATLGHAKEARGIYQRLLKVVEDCYGKESDEYNECLTEAGQSLKGFILPDAANA